MVLTGLLVWKWKVQGQCVKCYKRPWRSRVGFLATSWGGGYTKGPSKDKWKLPRKRVQMRRSFLHEGLLWATKWFRVGEAWGIRGTGTKVVAGKRSNIFWLRELGWFSSGLLHLLHWFRIALQLWTALMPRSMKCQEAHILNWRVSWPLLVECFLV